MVRPCTLVVVVTAYVCATGFGSLCSDRSTCRDLSTQGRLLDCLRLCESVIQTQAPDPGTASLKVTDDDDDDDDEGLILGILLIRIPANKILPPGLGAHSNKRRAYAMEHFRWGKPSGRKRRPVKAFASLQDGGGSSERRFRPQARRQLNSHEAGARADLNGKRHRKRGLLGARVSSKSRVQFSPQRKKTYQMRHFRWGRPSVSKRNGSGTKTGPDKPLRQLSRRLGKTIARDVQRMVGRTRPREEAGVRVVQSA